MIPVDRIKGSERLTELFGGWPSFHDAEVLRVELSLGEGPARGPVMEVDVRVFEITNEVGEGGFLVLKNDSVATLRFANVCELQLEGWGKQNVLLGLAIQDIRSHQLEGLEFGVLLDGGNGLDRATFSCGEVEVTRVRPWPGHSPGSIPSGFQSPPRAGSGGEG